MAYMTMEQFRQIYDEWKQSGLSVQQYCENTGLTERFLLLAVKAEGRNPASGLWQLHSGKGVRQVFSIHIEECIRQVFV